MTIKDLIHKIFLNNNILPIRKRIIRILLPSIISVILLMDVAVYFIVFRSISVNYVETVNQNLRIQADNLGLKYSKYTDDLNIIKRTFDYKNIEKSLKNVSNFIYGHSNKWNHFRITFPDGESFNNLTGKDTIEFTDQKYFRQIVKEGYDISFGNAFKSDIEPHNEVFSISIADKDSLGELKAILTAYFPASEIDNGLKDFKVNGGGYCAILERDFRVRGYFEFGIHTLSIEQLEHIGFSGIDKLFNDSLRVMENHLDDRLYVGKCEFSSHKRNKMAMVFVNIPGSRDMALSMSVYNYIFFESYYWLFAVMALLTIIAVGILYWITTSIAKKTINSPLDDVNTFVSDISKGNIFVENTTKSKLAAEFVALNKNLETMKNRLFEAIKSIKDYSQQISAENTILNKSITDVSQGAQIQASTIEEVSVSITNMEDIVKKNALAAEENAVISKQISSDINTITKASSDTLESIRNVIDKTMIVNEITNRTDLLAINAAVEASRAGENGKGFAVVASEIRKLSEQCKKASREIDFSSAQSLQTTQDAVNLIDKIAPAIITNEQKATEISDSCNILRQQITVIANSVHQLMDITETNSMSADEMESFAKKFNAKLNELNHSVSFFKLSNSEINNVEIVEQIEQHTQEILRLKSLLKRKKK